MTDAECHVLPAAARMVSTGCAQPRNSGSGQMPIGSTRQKTERGDQLGPDLYSLLPTLGHAWGRAQQ